MSDNLTTPFPAGTVLASKDLGTAQLPKNMLADSAGVEVLGTVTADPPANTIGGRLKAIVTAITDRLPTLGPKAASGSVSVTASSDGLKVSDAAGAPSVVYVPVTLATGNLAGGACRGITAEVAGRVNLKQPDGTTRDNYPLSAGPNPIGALMIAPPTSGTAATGVWALY